MSTVTEVCIACGAELRQGDRFCSQCGQGIPDVATSRKREHVSIRGVNGLSRFIFRRKTSSDGDKVEIKAAFTDGAAQVMADVIQTLAPTRAFRAPLASDVTDAASEFETDDDDAAPIETTAEVRARLEPPATPTPADPSGAIGGDIRKVFSTHNGVTKLERPKLKAKTQTEYAIRLIRMYLFYVLQERGVSEVPREEVYAFLKGMGIRTSVAQPEISRDQSIDKDRTKKTFLLNYIGEQQVKRYLEEMDNPEAEDGWYPGKDTRTPAARKRRTSKRSTDQKEGQEGTSETPNAEVEKLKGLVRERYEDVSKWPVKQLALLGLYAIRKQYGPEQDASYRKVLHYLYSTFELGMKERALRNALDQLKSASDNYVNQGKEVGYRITPVGMKRVEELLTLPPQQPTLELPDISESPGGTAQA